MSLAVYGQFLIFAAVLVLIPGPDFAVVTRNTLLGGRRCGHSQRLAHGFISNVSNPKVLVFYAAVLPQFLHPGAGLGWWLAVEHA